MKKLFAITDENSDHLMIYHYDNCSLTDSDQSIKSDNQLMNSDQVLVDHNFWLISWFLAKNGFCWNLTPMIVGDWWSLSPIGYSYA